MRLSNRPAALAVLVLVLAGLLLSPLSARADDIARASEDLRTGADFRLRVSAALALGKSKNALARGPLEQQMKRDDQEAVRAASAAGLGALGDPAAMGALEEAAQQDKSASVRETAKASLKKLRSASSASPSKARVLVKIGKLQNKSGAKGKDVVGRFKGATRAEAQKIPGVEVLEDNEDARATGKKRGLPVLTLDGTLRDLAPRAKGGVQAEVEYVVKREQALKGSVKGKGAVEDGASAHDAAQERELQDQALAAAIESALRGAPAVILASTQ